MRLKSNYYKYGIVVNHNPKNIRAKGSCIVIHIKDKPTAGCTAMTEPQMIHILKLLNKKVNPLLVQGIKSEIPKLIGTILPIEW
jgi:L,D-peptidoglycan transpeptidase YkuD (ErfK/YbiS/YcfS/YnhG family)